MGLFADDAELPNGVTARQLFLEEFSRLTGFRNPDLDFSGAFPSSVTSVWKDMLLASGIAAVSA
jgi:hypothetical protein